MGTMQGSRASGWERLGNPKLGGLPHDTSRRWCRCSPKVRTGDFGINLQATSPSGLRAASMRSRDRPRERARPVRPPTLPHGDIVCRCVTLHSNISLGPSSPHSQPCACHNDPLIGVGAIWFASLAFRSAPFPCVGVSREWVRTFLILERGVCFRGNSAFRSLA